MTEPLLLSEAIAKYRNKDYVAALDYFKKAGARYGDGIVATNILLCERALGTRPERKQAKSSTAPKELDPATKLMLSNEGAIELTDMEYKAVLGRYKEATQKRSEDAQVKPVQPVPADWPKDLILAPLPDSTNDYAWNRARKAGTPKPAPTAPVGLSIVIPTFNRGRLLDVTLACLVNQKTDYPFEVIVADDGSKESLVDVVRKYESTLDIKYSRQKDYGYQLCAVRNLGLRTARYEFVSILDCDMAPSPLWVQTYMALLAEDDDVALIGPRKYVDTSVYSGDDVLGDPTLIERLPEVMTNNSVAGKTENAISVDWRLEHFAKTDNLRLCNTPFRFFSGGNVTFSRKWLSKAGWFDEDFTHWGGEDNEFGYRLYRSGCFFRAVGGALAYHQEPPGKENETDRSEGKKITINIVREKVPYFYRKPEPVNAARMRKAPLVSIYIPAYNCAAHIVRCVDSALNQTITDLEVCICDDGSTDNTMDVVKRHYGGHPRVRTMTKANGGIGSASNAAVRMARGYYIGQLDSDDYLEPDAVESCLKEFLSDSSLACVYATNRNVNNDGTLIGNGYNWPEFSREKLLTAMIVHHFRLFTMRAWNLTSGFSEDITNAVDYDMYLKLSEVGRFKHVNKICYNRVLHGENTSIKKLGIQKVNHFKVVNQALKRQKVLGYEYLSTEQDDDKSRKYMFTKCESAPIPDEASTGMGSQRSTAGVVLTC